MCTNNMQAGPTLMKSVCQAGAIRATLSSFRSVSDSQCAGRRLDLADRNVVEKEGAYGNAERRTQFWRQQYRHRAKRNRISGS